MASSTHAHESAKAQEVLGQDRQAKDNTGIRVPAQPLLRRFYSSMLRCRIVAERIALLAREGKLPPDWASDAGLGREATVAGVAMRLLPKDVVAPSQRNFAAEVARGAPLDPLFRRLRDAGPAAGEQRPAFALVEKFPEAGSAVLALACAGQKNSAVVAFFDAAEADLAGWRNAVQVAGTKRLPILFVMENGSEKREPQPAARKKKGVPLGEAPLIAVDGTDVVAVSRVARESLRYARAGYGPTLMECKVGAALEGLCRAWGGKPQNLDPIRATEERLARQGLWSEAWKREVTESLEGEIDHAVAAAFSNQQSTFSRFGLGIDSKG